jgi:hypothetical protein
MKQSMRTLFRVAEKAEADPAVQRFRRMEAAWRALANEQAFCSTLVFLRSRIDSTLILAQEAIFRAINVVSEKAPFSTATNRRDVVNKSRLKEAEPNISGNAYGPI